MSQELASLPEKKELAINYMNIIKPYAKIIELDRPGYQLLQRIEAIGRVSHRSEGAQTDISWEKFIRAVVIGHGDWSITEHVSITVEAYVDRGITHEWVRHRIGAYTQESTRFVNYDKKMEPSFVMPGNFNKTSVIGMWIDHIQSCENIYKELLLAGETPQIARSVFPNALASKLIVTYNLRNWRHFFLMRTSKEAHPQMREVTIPLLEEFKAKIPILYEDIVPNSRQVDNLKLPR